MCLDGITAVSAGALLAGAVAIAMASLIVKKLTALVTWMVVMQAPIALVPALGLAYHTRMGLFMGPGLWADRSPMFDTGLPAGRYHRSAASGICQTAICSDSGVDRFC